MDSISLESLTAEESLSAIVAIPRPLGKALTYSVPSTLRHQIRLGSLVRVPFRNSTIEGFVVDTYDENKKNITPDKKFKLKAIQELIVSAPLFDEEDLKFYRWIADYYQTSLGEVFYSAFPKFLFKGNQPQPSEIEDHENSNIDSQIVLTEEQNLALTKISECILEKRAHSFLLYGVTGSGKTEVYLRAAKLASDTGRTSLILVPEIALTPQLRQRFEDRFGSQVAVLHSSLSEKKRRQYWWDIYFKRRRIVVGARSAIFAPIKNLGLLIVDEEHEPSYKQDDHLRYHARDLALVKAKLVNAVTILGSATPSLESYYAAVNGKHTLLKMMNRPAERPMPKIDVVDLKKSPLLKNTILSVTMKEALFETIKKGQQAMIFVNRKGYSSYLLCHDCGYVPHCTQCSVTMTYYQSSRSMRCHYCGLSSHAPDVCPVCFSRQLRFMGFGTEQVENELKATFPSARIERLDAEKANSAKKLEELLSKFRNGDIDVLVGTQMLAKGHDFPNVTFIGIVLAEMGLHLPDFRAGERTFQLLAQVSGRAGRANLAGKVLMQTYMPDHFVIRAAIAQDYDAFYREEIEVRKSFLFPPFARLAQLEFRHRNEGLAERDAVAAASLINHSPLIKEKLSFVGPAPASIAKIANEYRWQVLIRSEKVASLNSLLKSLKKEGVRLIDVDPINTL